MCHRLGDVLWAVHLAKENSLSIAFDWIIANITSNAILLIYMTQVLKIDLFADWEEVSFLC